MTQQHVHEKTKNILELPQKNRKHEKNQNHFQFLVFTGKKRCCFHFSKMGVPAFFRWLSKRCGAIVVNCVEEEEKVVDGIKIPGMTPFF